MFTVPKSKASIKQNRFVFKIGDDTFDVPLLKYLPGSAVEMLAEAEATGSDIQERAAQYAVFGAADTPIGKAVRTLEAEQLGALNAAWVKASGVSVGESSGSDDSSPSTAEPSDATSSAPASD